jgi:hypothetical protein
MESEGRELTRPLAKNRPVQPSSETNCQQEVPEELFVPSQESELAPHAPTGLSNPFWSA